MRIGLVFFTLLLTLVSARASAQSPDPSTLPLLTLSDLQDLGGARVPQGQSNGKGFENGGVGLAHNPITNTLFIGRGHDVAEITIPLLTQSLSQGGMHSAS